MKLINLFFYYKMKPKKWSVAKWMKVNSGMAAGCSVSLYRLWAVQIRSVPCWEVAVHTCTLKQNKDHQLEDTRLPPSGARMLLQVPVVQNTGPCLEVYRLGTKPHIASAPAGTPVQHVSSTHVPHYLISYSGASHSVFMLNHWRIWTNK